MSTFSVWVLRTLIIGVALTMAIHGGVAGCFTGAGLLVLMTPQP